MNYTLHGASGQFRVVEYPGFTGIVAINGNLEFDYLVASGVIPTDGSTPTHYIPPKDDGTPHVLPHYAMLPMLHQTDHWAPPSEETLSTIRSLLAATTNILDLGTDRWSKHRRLVSKLQDSQQGLMTPKPDTDMGWEDRWYEVTYGDNAQLDFDGWYYGTIFPKRDNDHYERLFWMLVRYVFEDDAAYRDGTLWPYLLEKLIAHLCFGTFHGGPNDGADRDEKGNIFIGDSGRVPFEKQWATNILAGFLATDSHPLFANAMSRRAGWWAKHDPAQVWKGYWGVRIAQHALEDYITIALSLPDWRGVMVEKAKGMLNQLDVHLDRSDWIWPNEGNRGAAPESPWMQWQAIAAICRCRELLPETVGYGPSDQELVQVAEKLLRDGSEDVGGFSMARYRMPGQHNEPTTAKFLANSAPMVPALRYLSAFDPYLELDYEFAVDLVAGHVGSSVSDIRNGTPLPEDQIGFRLPSEGPGWSKAMLILLGAVK